MAKPVISGTQSIPGYLQWEAFAFQPGVSEGTPASWTANGLPPGVSIDGTTGLISGAAALPGTYIMTATASNSDGSSTQEFVLGIEASAPTISTYIDVTWDIVTNKVTLTTAFTPAVVAAPQGAPLTLVKVGGDLILSITVTKSGAVLDLDITSVSNALTLSVKEDDEDAVVVTSDAFEKLGTGSDARYLVHASFTGAALLGAISDFPSDTEPTMPGLCELTLTFNNPLSGTFGPSTLTLKSDTFLVSVANNIA